MVRPGFLVSNSVFCQDQWLCTSICIGHSMFFKFLNNLVVVLSFELGSNGLLFGISRFRGTSSVPKVVLCSFPRLEVGRTRRSAQLESIPSPSLCSGIHKSRVACPNGPKRTSKVCVNLFFRLDLPQSVQMCTSRPET